MAHDGARWRMMTLLVHSRVVTSSHHILGQSRALRALGCALASGHVHHAWIFHGPAGVGKFRTAEEFARILLDPASTSINRERFQAPRDTPCARLIDAGTHPDFHVIRKELAGISESRELRDRKQMNIPLVMRSKMEVVRESFPVAAIVDDLLAGLRRAIHGCTASADLQTDQKHLQIQLFFRHTSH